MCVTYTGGSGINSSNNTKNIHTNKTLVKKKMLLLKCNKTYHSCYFIWVSGLSKCMVCYLKSSKSGQKDISEQHCFVLKSTKSGNTVTWQQFAIWHQIWNVK